MKKILSFILVLLLVIGMMPAAAMADDHIYAQMIKGYYSDLYLSYYSGLSYLECPSGVPAGVNCIADNEYINVWGTPDAYGVYDFTVYGYNSSNTNICAVHITLIVYEYEEWSCLGLDAGAGGAIQYEVGDKFDLDDCNVFSYWENQLGDTKVVKLGSNELYLDNEVKFSKEGAYDVDVYCDLPTYCFDSNEYWSYDGLTQFHTSVGCYASYHEDAPVIKTKELPGGIVGKDYYQELSASGDHLEWDVYYNPGHRNEFDSTGLTLSKDGKLYGTPKGTGSFQFTVMCGNYGGEDFMTYTLDITDIDTLNQYGLWVGGIAVNDYNKDDILNNGTCSYDPGTNVLTLKNAVIKDYVTAGPDNFCISDDTSLTVKLEGNNRIVIDGAGFGIYTGKYLNFIGDGKLVIEGTARYGDAVGVYSEVNVSIDGPEIETKMLLENKSSDAYTAAGLVALGDLEYLSGSFSLYGDDCGLYLGGKVDIRDDKKVLLCEGDELPGTPVDKLTGGENNTLSAKYVSIGLGTIKGSTRTGILDNPLYLVLAGLVLIIIVLLIIILKKKKK